MKDSEFRIWMQRLWFDNCEEHAQHGLPRYSQQEYWHKFKWWLRREFRHRRATGKL